MAELQTPEIVTLEPRPVALLRETVRMDALVDYFDRAFRTVAQVAQAQGAELAGPPVGLYYGMPGNTVDVGAGFPTDRPIAADAGVTLETLPGGRAAQVLHVGPYAEMQQTYGRLLSWLGTESLTPGPVMWEVYLTDPETETPENTKTLIVWPLAD